MLFPKKNRQDKVVLKKLVLKKYCTTVIISSLAVTALIWAKEFLNNQIITLPLVENPLQNTGH